VFTFISDSPDSTRNFAEKLAKQIKPFTVVALFGAMGMGKTAFTQGFVKGRGIDAYVSSPTFALVNEYSGNPSVYHFDMYRVENYGDLYSTGFFDYLDMGGILVVEWSENIENILPENSVRIEFSKGENENQRIIRVAGELNYENLGN